MAQTADPILLAPTSTTEACLRIQQSMPGTKAIGHIVTSMLPNNVVGQMFADDGEPPTILSYEFGCVDVTAYYEAVTKNRDGTLKNLGGGGGAWSSPFVWDTYKNSPADLDYMGDEDEGAEPRKSRTGDLKTAHERIRDRINAIGDPEITPEEVRDAVFSLRRATLTDTETVEPVGEARKPPISRDYEPMKSGVWVEAGVNEDDVTDKKTVTKDAIGKALKDLAELIQTL